MISFECDYNNGAHPDVIQALVDTNGEQTQTYGFDCYTQQAVELIKEACDAPDADVFLLAGGTQANATVIDGMLRSYEAVICPETGHINVHEAGAVEAFGHKVIGLPADDGRLDASVLDRFMQVFEGDESRDHVAQPGMVYVSFPTEMGTLYSAEQIENLYTVCRQHGLSLFVDGARLGYGLAADECDFDLPFLASHCDVFYIGGTKVGALCGEAVVFGKGAPRCFFSIVKRHGALLAKGRLVGVQFRELFSNGLYLRIARHAIVMAHRMRDILVNAGLQVYVASPTNQQFFIIPNERMHHLEKLVQFTHWVPYDDHSMVCRFVTSWATTDEDLSMLESLLRQ